MRPNNQRPLYQRFADRIYLGRVAGGAHILMGDGSIQFITDSIEAGDSRAEMIWRQNGMSQSTLPPGSPSPYGLGIDVED